jgi:hypothetical protein
LHLISHRHFDRINVVANPSSADPVLDAERGGCPVRLFVSCRRDQHHRRSWPPLFGLLRFGRKHHPLPLALAGIHAATQFGFGEALSDIRKQDAMMAGAIFFASAETAHFDPLIFYVPLIQIYTHRGSHPPEPAKVRD